MKQWFADVIVDLSVRRLDRVFQYHIPPELESEITAGTRVIVPFGNGDREKTAYVVSVTDTPTYDVEKTKDIIEPLKGAVPVEEQMILLASWMHERYGSTMNQALKTVMPVKSKVKPREEKTIVSRKSKEELLELMRKAVKRNAKNHVRVYEALLLNPVLPYDFTKDKLRITMSTLRNLEEKEVLSILTKETARIPFRGYEHADKLPLNEEQQKAADQVIRDYDQDIRKTYLLYGITGSGKTEVYMELIEHMLSIGKQTIVLIPEIALTYQTVMRFYKRFGDRIAIINSRLSPGEKYDQLERARKGEVDIMIGPRSALFSPFPRLGLIIIDEEHENSYRSEVSPRYDARETACVLARMNHASVVLGSATPSLESYFRAEKGVYGLLKLTKRAGKDSTLPSVSVVDMREELKEGNRSVFSRRLKELIEDRLKKKEQILLFMNRRGYANFVSCRSCGKPVRCPHCDVSLTYHKNGRLKCHYCGYEIPMMKKCPSCGSPFIAPFGTGTQKLEEMAAREFKGARILRMDADTTAKKGSHEEIIEQFMNGEADILIGTQMIVKGHDFPRVTLVGMIAADLSLHAPDYRSSERTFDLLVQAAGRAGRADLKGDVVIQTYAPDHFAIETAAQQDYEGFYEQEMVYRKIMAYPPATGMMTVGMAALREDQLEAGAAELLSFIRNRFPEEDLVFIGPVNASVFKVNDIYRKFLYIKNQNYDILLKVSRALMEQVHIPGAFENIMVQFDL